jgi:signal transduction histidine kinase
MMNVELKRLAHLLNDIEYQSLDKSDMATDFDLVLLICDLVALTRSYIAKKIILEVEASQSFIVCLPKNCLRQALFNLLLNAVEALDNKLSGHIYIKVDKLETDLRIQVLDNGKGFSQTLLDNGIPSLRASRQRGSGLGLAMTQEFVQSISGQIKLSNRPLQGACVTILLPETCLVSG